MTDPMKQRTPAPAEYSRDEAALRAGVALDLLDRMVELGLIVPRQDRFTAGDVRKAGIVADFVASGLPLDGLAAEIHGGRLALDFIENLEIFSAVGPESFEQVASRTGIPVEVLMVIRETVGSSVPRPTDRMRDIELAIVPLVDAQLALGYAPDVVERLLRTMGEGLQRYAQSESDAFQTNVIMPVVERPETRGVDISAAAVAGQERLAAATDQAILAVLHALEAHQWTTNVLGGFERGLEGAGLYARMERPPAMCFLDITGYTRLTAEQGDAAAVDLAGKLGRLVRRTALEHNGRPVKWLGDGVMLWFADPGPAVVAAIDMADGVVAAGLPPAHVGLHSGPIIVRDGDYYGQTVNIASRIAAFARPGEVLVSQAVVDATGDVSASAAVVFSPLGDVELKGVVGPVALHLARRA